jgi:hypothetical protein
MDITKRDFVARLCAATGSLGLMTASAQADPSREVVIDGVSFRWMFKDGRLIGELSAPTRGWIAVGFHSRAGLQGTYFVIASVADDVQRIEEHFAVVPNHIPIADLGWPNTARLQVGQFQSGVSSMSFSIAATSPSGARLTLQSGEQVNLMLAWSHEADFDHHSAWRKHIAISL